MDKTPVKTIHDLADDLPTPSCKKCLRSKIEKDVAEFLSAGGQIENLAHDATGLENSLYQHKMLRRMYS